jgi:hypothetical protein
MPPGCGCGRPATAGDTPAAGVALTAPSGNVPGGEYGLRCWRRVRRHRAGTLALPRQHSIEVMPPWYDQRRAGRACQPFGRAREAARRHDGRSMRPVERDGSEPVEYALARVAACAWRSSVRACTTRRTSRCLRPSPRCRQVVLGSSFKAQVGGTKNLSGNAFSTTSRKARTLALTRRREL